MLQKNWFVLLAVRISSYGCTWEVWRELKKLELLSAVAHAKHEPILNCTIEVHSNICYDIVHGTYAVIGDP